MCNVLHLLEEIDDYRFVAICEHGTIHISWNRSVIFLGQDEMLSLEACLDEAIAMGGELEPHTSRPFDDAINGRYVIWIYDFAHRMDIEEFMLFTDLINRASQKIEGQKPAKKIEELSVTYLPGKQYTFTPMLYSPN
ncbi:MAG: hypothetical protein AAF490_03550 [Chloroflexota bacterium]